MINSFKNYLIEEEKTVYFTFGRMNPPTTGHEKLMNELSKKSGSNPYKVYLSQSTDKKKNPLDFKYKVKTVRKFFPKHARQVMLDKKVKNVFEHWKSCFCHGRPTPMPYGVLGMACFNVPSTECLEILIQHGEMSR